MPRLLNILTSKPSCGPVWVAFVLLGIFALNTQAKIVLTVPQQVSLSANFFTQQLTISWFGGEATTFDLIILRTEFNETVFYNTVPTVMNQDGGRHQWTWTSVEPLECTSLSVKIRSRDGITKSEWSEPQILKGRDLPSNSDHQVYPQDKVVPVGGNTTFCCIVEEGKEFRDLLYGSIKMNVKRLSRRSYATTAVNQNLSRPTGTNVLCRLKNKLAGSVIFVGYPPLPTNFECITDDLTSAVCYWDRGRGTNLYGKRKTSYSINKRDCPDGKCVLPEWDGNWTLLAVNPLGQYSLTYSAELLHRVVPVAPDKLSATDDAWNATVQWHWPYSSYSTLALVCQVQLASHDILLRNFSGVGLHSVFLPHLHPNTKYRVRVRCGSLNHFLKWGNWSKEFHFTTKSYVPEAPDVWMFVNRDNSVQVMWKPLTRWQSHGVLTGYEVTLWNLEENENQTNNLSPKDNSLNLTDWASITGDKKAIASVKANNVKGMSQPSSIMLGLIDDKSAPLAQTIYTSSGFPLSWQHSDNSTGGYLVEWCEAVCTSDCAVDWIRLDTGITHVSIKDSIVKFQPGVRYNFSLYECPSVSPVLIRRWQGYIQELPPSISVNLEINQQDCDVVLSWEEIPLAGRRGFLLGYKVYKVNNFSNFTLLDDLSPEMRTYTVKDLSTSTYKFTVKAYTSAGEDTGGTAAITLKQCADGLILEILTSLGIVTLLLTTVSCFCYKKRRWVKKAFYPDIPEPKLPGDWSRTQGPLDVKPFPHSMVHIIEKPEWDFSKDTLVIIPEEEDYEGEGIGDEPVDTDEPQLLRYYNQVVDERPIRPRFPDSSVSSSSSVDSANTDVTYTGIQTSHSSLVFPSDSQGFSEGFQPHSGLSLSSRNKGEGYHPQMHSVTLGGNLASPEPIVDPHAVGSEGYKPQNSWLLDSPTEGDENSPAPSLGSPTSVASTQFLLPDRERHEEKRQQPSSAANWFTNLLSSAKP
ncbi:LIF receptor subunit alpha a [Xiphophorus hellerii]|uniref:LIF receptor subunit alpha a n=1 Tax=Xiphophorus hellerii TaxID=8084 RepID=UPI0013B35EE9|nr:leukemia inhibitory factor receptor-like [Xiphophorus hellerii]XP_032435496.1 leukemia inhibitory factor receptor-like [Xiphophorus hellerii]